MLIVMQLVIVFSKTLMNVDSSATVLQLDGGVLEPFVDWLQRVHSSYLQK